MCKGPNFSTFSPIFIVLCFVYVYVVLGLELMASVLAEKALYHLSHTPNPFAFGDFFHMWSHVFAQVNLGPQSSCFSSKVAGITEVYHHDQLVLRGRVFQTFCQGSH
jgi:hypothetical protein